MANNQLNRCIATTACVATATPVNIPISACLLSLHVRLPQRFSSASNMLLQEGFQPLTYKFLHTNIQTTRPSWKVFQTETGV